MVRLSILNATKICDSVYDPQDAIHIIDQLAEHTPLKGSIVCIRSHLIRIKKFC